MSRHPFFILVVILGLTPLSRPTDATAGHVTVGGTTTTNVLQDWGIGFSTDTRGDVDWGSIDEGNLPSQFSVFEGTHTTSSGFSFIYAIEDTVTGRVGPRYGGQNYDAEFLGIGIDDGQLVIALVTGQRPDNGVYNYAPGDLYIGTDQGVFGVELSGSTYDLYNNGHTRVANPNAAGREGGTIWKDPSWILATPFLPDAIIDGVDYGANAALKNVQINHSSTPLSQKVGTAAGFYSSGNSLGTQHAVFELGIDLSLFGGATIQGVHWSPSCGNDLLYPITNISTAVPEPATAGMMLMGTVGLFGFARRRRQKVALEESC